MGGGVSERVGEEGVWPILWLWVMGSFGDVGPGDGDGDGAVNRDKRDKVLLWTQTQEVD